MTEDCQRIIPVKFGLFVALCPKSTAMVIAGRYVKFGEIPLSGLGDVALYKLLIDA